MVQVWVSVLGVPWDDLACDVGDFDDSDTAT